MVADSLHTVYEKTYVNPADVVPPVRAPVVLCGNPTSQGRAVVLRFRQALKGRMPGRSCVPGNVARTLRLALRGCCTNEETNCVNAKELQEGLLGVGIGASLAECMVLVRTFDTVGDDAASLLTITDEIRGHFSDRRALLVENVYNLLKSVSSDGLVTFQQLADLTDLRFLPSVQEGAATLEEAKDVYCKQMDFACPTALLQAERFGGFFADFSFEVDIDNDFEKVMRNMFHLSGGIGPSANTSCRRVRVTHLNGRITDEEIKNDITIRGDAQAVKEAILKNLRTQGITDVKDFQVTNEV
ncbi:calcyphosin [Strigomonas culicis]|nr:calcyphosin [Strigomonas culicis]|eukprot:EPY27071.1 calcyphosin [Strigomonas culicis]